MARPDPHPAPAANQRLDKWLWFARVIKSRTQAAALVTDGKVRVNRARVDKASTTVKPGDVVTVTVRGSVRVLKITAPGSRRGPPAEALTLYEEIGTPQSLPGSRPPAGPDGASPLPPPRHAFRQPGSGRPTKRDRRRLSDLTDTED